MYIQTYIKMARNFYQKGENTQMLETTGDLHKNHSVKSEIYSYFMFPNWPEELPGVGQLGIPMI